MSSSQRGYRQKLLDVVRDYANNMIISLLSTGEYSSREIAYILGFSEREVSRRLSRMYSLGIVDYRRVKIGSRDLVLYTLRGEKKIQTMRQLSIPVIPYFVGREKELGMLTSSGVNVHIVTGAPGIGKTTLVAEAARRYYEGPVYWINLSELDYYDFLVREIALFLASIGYSSVVEYIVSGETSNPTLVEEITNGIDESRILVVVDDYYKVRDKKIGEFIASIASSLRRGKLVVVSRDEPGEITVRARTSTIELRGIEYQEAIELFEKIGVDASPRDIAEIYIATRGHPGLLVLTAYSAKNRGVRKVVEIAKKGSLQKHFWEIIHNYITPREEKILLALCCFDEFLPPSVLEEIIDETSLREVLRSLTEKGLVVETNYAYKVVDFVKMLSLLAGARTNCNTYYKALGKYYLGDGSIKGFFRALNYFSRAGCIECLVEALYYRITSISYRIFNYIDLYESILKSIENRFYNYDLIKLVDYELGVVYLNKEFYEEAITRFRRVVSLAGLRDPFLSIQSIARLVDMASYGLVDYREAIELAEKAEELLPSVNSSLRLYAALEIYTSLARLYTSMRDYRRAYREVLREVKAAREHPDPLVYVIAKIHSSSIKRLVGEYRESLRDLQEIYDILLSLGIRAFAGRIATTISRMYLELGDYESSIKYGEEALKLYEIVYNQQDYCREVIPVILSNIVVGNTRRARELELDSIKRCSNIVLDERLSSNKLLQFLYSITRIIDGENVDTTIDDTVLGYLSREIGEDILRRIIEIIEMKGYRDYAEKIRRILAKLTRV